MKVEARRLGQQDLLAAFLTASVGIAGLWFGRSLEWGKASAMGPGYLPLGLSWLLIAISVILAAKALLRATEPIAPFRVSPALILVLATIVFGLSLERIGLAPSVFVVALIATFAGEPISWLRRLSIAAILSAACVVIFVYLLRQPIAIGWWE